MSTIVPSGPGHVDAGSEAFHSDISLELEATASDGDTVAVIHLSTPGASIGIELTGLDIVAIERALRDLR